MNEAIQADKIAIIFWIVLIIWSLNEIRLGNYRAYLVLMIITGALIVDSYLVIKYGRKIRYSKPKTI
ncbi:MAG: hypothetical protein Q8R00_04960 [Candidatus Nanoarchaeia archaeon]|nr:hypothetical protein [Candidatus Nanoarchaeia archaeon]